MPDSYTTLEDLAQRPLLHAYHDVASQLKEFVYRTFRERLAAGRALKDRAVQEGPSALRRRQAEIRSRFLESIGGLPPSEGPVEARVVGSVQAAGQIIERVILVPRAGVYVTANLYLPLHRGRPAAAILFLCGHDRDAKASPQYQAACQVLVGAGFVVLCMDPVGQGERYSYFDPVTRETSVRWGCPEHDHVGAQCLLVGDSSARYFLHDAMRAMDYLGSRPEVDPSRIGITGNSGGGTQCALLMMTDPRVAAAAPATYITSMAAYLETGIVQDAEQVFPGMLRHGFDHDDILLGMAPRPVLLLAAKSDYFPIEGTRQSFESARRFWRAMGAPGAFELHETEAEHCYSPEMARAAADFFSRHLRGPGLSMRPQGFAALEPSVFPAAKIACTTTGQVRGEIPGARFLFDENLARAADVEDSRRAQSDFDQREGAQLWLSEAISYNRRPVPLNPRRFLTVTVDGLDATQMLWWSNDGLLNAAVAFAQHGSAARSAEKAVLAFWDGGTRSLPKHRSWIQAKCSSGFTVLVVDVSGVGSLEVGAVNTRPLHEFEGTYCAFAHDLAWQGDSLPALRAWDVTRAVEAAQAAYSLGAEHIHVAGMGEAAVPVALAAFATQWRHPTTLTDLPPDRIRLVRDRLYDDHDIMSRLLPGMLKHFDLSEILSWLGMTGAQDGAHGEA